MPLKTVWGIYWFVIFSMSSRVISSDDDTYNDSKMIANSTSLTQKESAQQDDIKLTHSDDTISFIKSSNKQTYSAIPTMPTLQQINQILTTVNTVNTDHLQYNYHNAFHVTVGGDMEPIHTSVNERS